MKRKQSRKHINKSFPLNSWYHPACLSPDKLPTNDKRENLFGGLPIASINTSGIHVNDIEIYLSVESI